MKLITVLATLGVFCLSRVECDYVYVADQGLQVLDVANKAAPRSVALIPYVTFGATSVVVSEHYAYLTTLNCVEGRCAETTGFGVLHVVDISDPTKPVVGGNTTVAGFARCVAIQDGYAYVAMATFGLQIIDVRDPMRPVNLGSVCPPKGNTHGVAVRGNYAYLADNNAGFVTVDVSDKQHPKIVHSVAIQAMPMTVTLSGTHAFVGGAAGNETFAVLDVSLTHASKVGSLKLPGQQALGVSVAGNLAYVANYDAGLVAVNITDVSKPMVDTALKLKGNAWDVVSAEGGDVAFVAVGNSGAEVVSTKSVSNPVVLGSTALTGQATSVFFV
eukprot:Rhum_TRINITY_DN25457_c0_g1::Rhum_TRINITY_DN25457_c0_g1_i1::g.182176::m.182176